MSKTFPLSAPVTRAQIMDEVLEHLRPFADNQPISGGTTFEKGLSIDSLAVMDMVMELEDQFDVSISMIQVTEIYTVDQLVDEILRLRHRAMR